MHIGPTTFGVFVIGRNDVPIIRTTAPELERSGAPRSDCSSPTTRIDDLIRDRGEEVELIPH